MTDGPDTYYHSSMKRDSTEHRGDCITMPVHNKHGNMTPTIENINHSNRRWSRKQNERIGSIQLAPMDPSMRSNLSSTVQGMSPSDPKEDDVECPS